VHKNKLPPIDIKKLRDFGKSTGANSNADEQLQTMPSTSTSIKSSTSSLHSINQSSHGWWMHIYNLKSLNSFYEKPEI
jgi:hypothetical protein